MCAHWHCAFALTTECRDSSSTDSVVPSRVWKWEIVNRPAYIPTWALPPPPALPPPLRSPPPFPLFPPRSVSAPRKDACHSCRLLAASETQNICAPRLFVFVWKHFLPSALGSVIDWHKLDVIHATNLVAFLLLLLFCFPIL
eukprot:GHVS01101350.1.p1 GENE.GHVS01101350.1~~GHVS01101350.1.p1  ORF type:complete len:142 (-),score=25.40 GHVS01101350.1:486-911(-)